MRGFLGTTAVVVGMGAGLAWAQTPGITGVGTPGYGTAVNALSADGTIAVGNTAVPNPYHAFRWVRSSPNSGVLTLLPDGHMFGNGDQARAVTADGQVVFGFNWIHEVGVESYEVLRWDPPYSSATTMTGAYGTCGYGSLGAVSGNGLVAIGYYTHCSGGCYMVPTFWSNASSGSGESHCLVRPAGWYSQDARSVSDHGTVIVGNVSFDQGNPGPSHAYMWRGLPSGEGVMYQLPPLDAHAGPTRAYAVSRDGAFAAGDSSARGRTHLVRWALSGGVPGPAEDLGPPPTTAPGATLYALNADGSVGAGGDYYSAIWWTQRTGAVNLNTYLPAHGVDLAGWHLTSATCLSNDGFTVGGSGLHNGQGEGFVVVMPRCGSADFDHDGDTATDADIEAFFACLAGSCCAGCESADFDWDGSAGTDADIEAFFRVLAGEAC
jgi:uncharacterized membrane protein